MGSFSKKILVFVSIAAAVFTALIIFSGKTDLFTGALKLSFKAPAKEDVIEGNFIGHQEAVLMLVNAALRKGMISQEAGRQFLDQAALAPQRQKITRGEFAAYTVNILGLNQREKNEPLLVDVSPDHPYAQAIARFAESGGVEITFKPDNFVTVQFANKTIGNLAR